MKKITDLLLLFGLGMSMAKAVPDESIIVRHPRIDYLNVKDIHKMEKELRSSLGALERYSFSRGWW
ncbi:MAG: hypothetical protein VX704_08400, partial [Verrucomicrobiota bacterium]|nr:hypothetical protein [Verrucomicrobiota bacterium]